MELPHRLCRQPDLPRWPGRRRHDQHLQGQQVVTSERLHPDRWNAREPPSGRRGRVGANQSTRGVTPVSPTHLPCITHKDTAFFAPRSRRHPTPPRSSVIHVTLDACLVGGRTNKCVASWSALRVSGLALFSVLEAYLRNRTPRQMPLAGSAQMRHRALSSGLTLGDEMLVGRRIADLPSCFSERYLCGHGGQRTQAADCIS